MKVYFKNCNKEGQTEMGGRAQVCKPSEKFSQWNGCKFEINKCCARVYGKRDLNSVS